MEKLFRNFYECPECHHQWSDTWSAMSDDTCPACQLKNITPYHSDDISEGE
jgi:rubrerythrin